MEQINPAQNDQIIQTSNENSAVETTTANQLNTIIDQSTAEIKYVGFWSRLLAFTIDIIILITLSLIIQVIYIDTILKYLAVVYSPDYNFVILKLVILALWIYHIYRTCRYGATLGKVILGLKVVSNKSKKNKRS